MRQLESKEIKQILFQILSDFADYCDKNELRYYLCGGTLLGAVRHKGFIPWDDDIDVLMPRPDFDKLHELLKHNNIKNYYEIIGVTAGNSFWPFAKLVDKRTKTENAFYNSDKHLWIDIFPMDGLPDDKQESDRLLSIAPKKKIWFTRSNASIGEGRGIRKYLKIPLIVLLKLTKAADHLGIKMDKLAHTYDFSNSKNVGDIVWSLGPKERFEKETFLPVVDLEFCGKMFHAPLAWDIYLSQIYGDYMKLPPEEQRVNHETIAFIDDER